MTHVQLIDLLAELGDELDEELGTSHDDLAARVLARLDDDGPFAAPSSTRMPRWLLAAAAVVLVLALVVAVPGTRRTVARWFGVGSVRIEPAPTPTMPTTSTPTTNTPTTNTPTTTVTRSTVPEPLDLGPAVTAQEAVAATGLPLPSATMLGEPTSWHLPGGPQIVARHDVDGRTVLVAALAGTSDADLFAKRVGPDAIEHVAIDGTPAVWVHGEPHWFGYIGRDGQFAEEPLRLASDTLLWERAGVTYRVEGAVDLGEALEIARSMER